ncbi:MAG: hypothetical protein ABIR34_04740, partial [Marmoricola sp.]
MNLELGRAIADAVLYEGYLLYPYRSTSSKNQSRWQFGVVGPPSAAEAGLGEAASMTMQTVLATPHDRDAGLVVHLRFLQLQRRQIHDTVGSAVSELVVEDTSWTTWDEALERELEFTFSLGGLEAGSTVTIHVDDSSEYEPLTLCDGSNAGAVVRRTWPLSAELSLRLTPHAGRSVLELQVRNTHPGEVADKETATRFSLIGTHLLLEAHGVAFVSMVDPPEDAAELVATC